MPHKVALVSISMETPADKTKAERLTEGIRILKKLRDFGVQSHDIGQKEIQATITKWVNDGEPIKEKIWIPRIGRDADMDLTSKKGETAVLVLRAQ